MVYKFIRANGGWENFTMYPLYEFSCDNKQEAVLEEQWWYELLRPSLCSEVPGRTKKEYIKEWRENNKGKIAERKSQKIACNCGCSIARSNLAKHKRTTKHQKLMQAINE